MLGDTQANHHSDRNQVCSSKKLKSCGSGIVSNFTSLNPTQTQAYYKHDDNKLIYYEKGIKMFATIQYVIVAFITCYVSTIPSGYFCCVDMMKSKTLRKHVEKGWDDVPCL